MAGSVDRANGEENVVLADVEGYVGLRSGVAGVGPGRAGRIAPQDFIGCAGWRERGGIPCKVGVVIEIAREDSHVAGLGGSGGQRGEHDGVQACDASDVVCVDELEQVAVLDAILCADSLVLVVEVFAPLGEADGGKTGVIEADVVASAEIAIAAKDEIWMEVWR